MKPHDKRRLNAMIKDEQMGEREYKHMADEMYKIGDHEHAELFSKMAYDEARHATYLRRIKGKMHKRRTMR